MFIASLILLQVIIFAALIFILRSIMSKNVVVATSHLEEMSKEYAKKEQEISRQLEEIKVKSQETLNKAEEDAQSLKAQIIKEAESERDKLVKQARTHSEEIIQQADKSREQLLAEINERIAESAVEKARELIQETLPEQFKQDVHAHWVDELIANGFSELEDLHIPPGLEEIRVVSPFSLSEAQRKGLLKRLKEVIPGSINIKEEIDPSVVAGIVVNLGSLVLDGSLKNKIQEKVKRA